jgi:hypothetical protein
MSVGEEDDDEDEVDPVDEGDPETQRTAGVDLPGPSSPGLTRPFPDLSSISSLLGSTSFLGVNGFDFARDTLPNVLGLTNLLGGVTSPAVSALAEVLRGTDYYGSMGTLSALARYASEVPALSRAKDYATPDPSRGAYSAQMESPASYFGSTEEEIASFDDLHSAITTLISKTPELPLVWRGVRNATWGLHSHLYRHLKDANGVIPPKRKPKKAQPYPDEDQMVAAEREILRIARADWRFDNMSALETFARIQHAGGPTRLIDVTKNPYIGAWFAVEADREEDGQDGRLFALATRPVGKDGKPPAPDAALSLDDLGASRDPFWHLLKDTNSRQKLDWGTGARRRVWVPPAYDPRISAQNAAFILDGVPITSASTASYFAIEHNVYWRRADLLASASIYTKMHSPQRKPRYNSRNFAPTFSFRIKAEAKAKIREVMESRFGYRLSYVYPDVAALAAHLKTLGLAAKPA